MSAPVKEIVVAQRHLEYGNLKAPDHGLHHRMELTVFQDKIKQHRHEIDDVAVHLADIMFLPGFRPEHLL